MRIIDIALKEISLIKSQTLAMLILLLYPLTIVFAITLALGGSAIYGSALGSAGIDNISVAAYVPEASAYFDYDSFLQELNESERLNVFSYGSAEEVKKAVAYGAANVGLVVKDPNSPSGALNVEIYYDNVSPFISTSLLYFSESKIKQMSSDAALKKLGLVWQNLDGMQKSLYSEREKVKSFITLLGQSRSKLARLERDINSINLSEVKSSLDEFGGKYENYNSDIDNAGSEIGDAQLKLSDYESELGKTRYDLQDYKIKLTSIRDSVRNAKENSVEPLRSALQGIEDRINEEITKIDGSIATVDSAESDISDAKARLSDAKFKLAQAKSDLGSANSALGTFSAKLNSAEEILGESKAFIAETKNLEEDAIADLQKNGEFLTGLINSISEFREMAPEQLVQPITISEVKLFDVKNLHVMIVISIIIVLLLTSILLTGVSTVLEREQGIAFRVGMSATGKTTWIIGKILGQMFFVLLISLVILAISMLFVGIPIKGNALDIAIALIIIPFSFVCLSLLIARFANNFSTIVLASLLIIIPMLLISGIMFPIEFMPRSVAFFSGLLPLTVAKDLLLGVMLRGIPLVELGSKVFSLLSCSLVFLGIYLIGRKI